jgi:hypothetical protein
LTRQTAEIPGLVLAGIDGSRQQHPHISDEMVSKMKNVVNGAFNTEEILNTIKLGFQGQITVAEAKELLHWYESDLGYKITDAEEQGSTPEAYRAILAQAKTLIANQEMMNIAIEMDNLVNVTDFSLELSKSTALAVFTAITTIMDPDAKKKIAQFKGQLSMLEEQMRSNTRQMVLLSFVYAYREIKPQSLRIYIEFLKKPVSKKFNDLVLKSFKSAIGKSIDMMAWNLAVDFKESVETGSGMGH